MMDGRIDLNSEERPAGCQHFVQRKKRYCRMTVKDGEQWCGEHKPAECGLDDDTNVDKRIPCPLDPKHTCFASKLEKHMKICNAKEVTSLPPYIKKGCNWPEFQSEPNKEVPEKTRCLNSVPLEILKSVIAKVESVYKTMLNDCKPDNYMELPPHEVVKKELQKEERGNNTKRHLLQTSSLLQILEKEGLVQPNTCFIELGAGKGHVSYYLARSLSGIDTASVVLVDRASHRHKQDNKLDKNTLSVERIRADIKDLYLNEVELVKQAERVVGVSKHLCGAATDLALRCITNPDVLDKTAGVVMATCCHHRCDVEAYVARDFLEEFQISKEYFDIICGIVSWATCGTGFSRERRKELKERSDDIKRQKISSDNFNDSIESTVTEDAPISEVGYVSINNDLNIVTQTDNLEEITNNEKEIDSLMEFTEDIDDFTFKNVMLSNLEIRTAFGRHAKAVLDYGRVNFLQKCGFSAKLCYYVKTDTSPENVCIVAIKK